MRVVLIACVTGILLAGCGQDAASPPAPRTAAPPTDAPSPTGTTEPDGWFGEPGVGYDHGQVPQTGRPGAHRRLETPVVATGPSTRPRVALTFDADMTSGMLAKLRSGRVESYYNADVIEALRRLHVSATLFLTGMWMEVYPERTRELAADPLFELGTHSYSHRAFTSGCYGLPVVPPNDQLPEVTKAVEILDSLDPAATRWFRFPGACLDDTALRTIAPAGVTAVQYDVAGADGDAPSPEFIVNRVLRQARNGSIVVLHMHGGRAPYTDEAIPAIVSGLRERGFELVTVTKLLRP